MPSAGFTFTTSPASNKAPVALRVTDTSTSVACGITSWLWSFGDNTTSNVQNPTVGSPHTYLVAGTYTVTLKVTNAAGSRTTGGVQIVVKP
ncbi:MAG: PKD domain-containing protein [Chloroflexi bacterium]|nr:PKD domain-containing protein [Chloroflexota bacterium]